MKTTQQMIVFTCDGCGKTETVEPDDLPPYGYHGSVALHNEGGGGWGGDWYACRPACIRKAVLAVVENSD